ncbi:MAG: hypothetical protein A2Y06_02055 [Omnitrophica WOR_2 bacterium GWA2_37_7]|nr:MAG: hypothetical protein A2Y06_02055 [Omnitrophica WOR_2 bacterium GWA2_37_7]OGX61218.1 MAG: hypothetical protein A2471_01900 [Omnitrophica WOR_2 bacterium RIFOXYC2_FULL_45_15]
MAVRGVTFFIVVFTLFLLCGCLHNVPRKQFKTLEGKKKFAKEMGIILPGMTKNDVKGAFGLVVPEFRVSQAGQEIWHYNSPEEQDIYFRGDVVERIEYYPKAREIVPEIAASL